MGGRKFRLKLRTRLLIYILSATAVIYVGALLYIVFNTKKALVDESISYVNATAEKNANRVKDDLDVDITICRTIASAYLGYKDIPKAKRVKIYNDMLKNVLLNDNHFVSFWVSWELNAIDPDYDREHGRERYTYYRDGDQLIYQEEVLETNVEQVSGIYYDIKAKPAETITEPYFYSYTGEEDKQILEASVAVPIMDNGEFAGLVGADIELERFHSIISKIKPFENAYAFLVSNQGSIVSHPKQDLINMPVSDSELGGKNNENIVENIRAGKSFAYETKLNDNETYYVSFAPFTVGNSNTPWSVAILVPKSVILSKANQILWISVIVGLIGLLLIGLIIRFIANKITNPLRDTTKILTSLSRGIIDQQTQIRTSGKDELSEMAQALEKVMVAMKNSASFAREIGKGNLHESFEPLGEKDVLGNALLRMRSNLVELRKKNDENHWMQNSILQVSETLQGEKSAPELASETLSVLSKILDFNIASLFLEEEGIYKLIGSYAYNKRKSNSNQFKPGSGLIGQAVLEKKTLTFTDVPDDYISIKSGLGEVTPSHILIVPLIFQKEVIAVLEMGSVKAFNKLQMDLIEQVSENLAIAFNSIKIRSEMKALLIKTQEQAEELRVQQEELREANEELESQTKALKASEEELQEQQEELRVTNEELEEKTKSLEQQKSEISEKNLQLENTRKDLERKAEELAVASKYKSEFLANMSHELRTPLNSLLILSQSLADNKDGNLNEEQVESAEIIQKSGTDLLNMINDILDLSKIESGKMTINYEAVDIQNVSDNIYQYFKHVTEQKGIDLSIEISDKLPSHFTTDQQKLEQVIKNFVSNAVKFTNEGGVRITFDKAPKDSNLSKSGLEPENAIAISVIDTGIGIPKDKQLEIFEAFQQVDGSTSRNYGGTGLGLSISRELTRILGGEIQLVL
ncbi:MAG: GAF domain-containing protein [Bacteroidales bacterium]|nr:GAF domain-containing protein [Bacteroidales bacterium]MCF8388351.1 GAF domain-containing protein [Bacteroidales bacterium]MCF8399273.1 GAF domain-containing protein [Bacteroidales bacterium]